MTRPLRSLALMTAVLASLAGDCEVESPTGVPPVSLIPGSYIMTLTRSSTTGGCPSPVSSPRTVAVSSNSQGLITIPFFIGTGTLADRVDTRTGDWLGEGEVTLANGITVAQALELIWREDAASLPAADGTLEVEHVAPDGTVLCVETYVVTVVRET